MFALKGCSINAEIKVESNAPVRLTSAQLEELYRAYSPRGRKSKVDPRVMFKVMVYGYQCGIYSSRKLEEACRCLIAFMWLLEDMPAPNHAMFVRFRSGSCAKAADDLFYQYARLLEKQLAKVKRKVQEATVLKTLEALAKHLQESNAAIEFVHGKGRRKSQAQRDREVAEEWRRRWESYERDLRIIGNGRNSYLTTNQDATFMRMKEDHMGKALETVPIIV